MQCLTAACVAIVQPVCECLSAVTWLIWLSQVSGSNLAAGTSNGTALPQPWGVAPPARWEDLDPDQALKAAMQRQQAEEAVALSAVQVTHLSCLSCCSLL